MEQFKLSGKQTKVEFMEFLSSYSKLLSAHLIDLHREMETAVLDVMNQVETISKSSESQSLIANQALTSTNGEIKKVDVREKIRAELSQVDGKKVQDQMSQSLVSAGNRLKEEMKLLDHVEMNIKDSIFKIMGYMSNDDVVRQRLEHIGQALEAMQSTISELYSQGSELTTESVVEANKRLSEKVLKSFTMEDERAQFKKIFN
jgi:hypothetical protein